MRPGATRRKTSRWSWLQAIVTAWVLRATGPQKSRACWGVRAVLATSYERIHRSNLIGMGILPLEIPRDFVDLEPGDSIRVEAVEVSPRCQVPVTVTKVDGSTVNYLATAAVETGNEAQLLVDGGVIPSILSLTTRKR